MKKIVYMVVGSIGVGLGTVGVVLPILPTVPFLLLAALCFARSSEKLNRWFTGTKLYQKNLESYVKGQGMTREAKVRIMVTVTILTAIGFAKMHEVVIGRIVLAIVWLFHVLYFTMGVKTLKVQKLS